MNNRVVRRALACLAASALAVGVLSACGGSSDGSGPRELSFFVAIQPGGTIEETSKRCSEESNGKYTITPEFLPTDASQQREQLVRRLGAEDSSIDIVGMDVVWTGEFANAGWVEEWKGPLKQQVTEKVFDNVIETASFERKLFAAPFNTNTQLLWYRKDLVKTPPKTWDEMIEQAEALKEAGTIQVQANRYEGFMVWANALIESAGTEILSGPEKVDLEQKQTEAALEVMGRLANSSAAPTNLSTSDEDSARLAFEAGESAFMTNYTFAYASAQSEAPDIGKNMGYARFPEVVAGTPSKPPLGGFNLAVSSFSENKDVAFKAAACLADEKSQKTAVELDGLPPSRSDLYATKEVQKAYPGFANLVKESIEDSGPRPTTPAYQDVSLAVQRTLHPPDKIDPEDASGIYEELKSNLEDAVKREGLL
ncbi:MAG TPA: ABC transporter substrate-binding protein [Solirubrobacterales bacterium]|jgi:multiple sugar transport system substrate-binding protein|nr:ABC transporter substrate-binding protein [Solirubrobacterales bacterium]